MTAPNCKKSKAVNQIISEPIKSFKTSWARGTSRGKIVVRVACADTDKLIHSDEINIQSDKQRSSFRNRLIEMGLDSALVEQDLMRLITETLPPEPVESKGPDPLLRFDDEILADANEKLSNCENLLELAYSDASELGIVGEEQTVLLLYLAGISRLLDKPLSVIVQGSSASGKSFTIDKVSELFPDEAKIIGTQFTPQSLFYLPKGALRHKLVICGERSRVEDDNTAEATRALREMISGGILRKWLPVKSGDTLETVLIESEGPIAFVESTTLDHIFDEDRNRCVLIHTDESEEQTRRILRATAGKRQGNLSAIQRQQAMQLLLKPYPVTIPFAVTLAEHLPAPVECRRAMSHLLSCIKASALLHQRQREMQDGHIVANESDYCAAYQLLAIPMTEAIGGGVSKVAKEFWYWIGTHFGNGKVFSVQELLGKHDCPKATDRTYALVKELERVKCLAVVQVEKARSKHYKMDRSPELAGSPLPEPEIVFQHSGRKVGI
jgi:hypothetical protein